MSYRSPCGECGVRPEVEAHKTWCQAGEREARNKAHLALHAKTATQERIAALEAELAEAQRRLAKCVEALRRIQRWFGEFPEATLYDGTRCPYGVAYGSNGERDYMRAIATAALDAQESAG